MQNCIATLFKKQEAKHKDGMIILYRISEHIAKCVKSHSIEEKLSIPAIEECVYTVMHQDPTNDLQMLHFVILQFPGVLMTWQTTLKAIL